MQAEAYYRDIEIVRFIARSVLREEGRGERQEGAGGGRRVQEGASVHAGLHSDFEILGLECDFSAVLDCVVGFQDGDGGFVGDFGRAGQPGFAADGVEEVFQVRGVDGLGKLFDEREEVRDGDGAAYLQEGLFLLLVFGLFVAFADVAEFGALVPTFEEVFLVGPVVVFAEEPAVVPVAAEFGDEQRRSVAHEGFVVGAVGAEAACVEDLVEGADRACVALVFVDGHDVFVVLVFVIVAAAGGNDG